MLDSPATPRTGLFWCRCTDTLGRAIDLRAVVQARVWPEAAWVEEHEVLCAPEGRALLAERIRERRLERVVVAACSPHEHEATFRQVMAEAGLSPHLLEMVNLREQCEWQGGLEGRDPETPGAATEIALRSVRGALARVALHRPIPVREVDASPDVVVIGAGVAGLSAARTLAQKGRRVHLVEREAAIGGHLALLDEVFPTNKCASCFLDPVLGEVLDHPRLEVHLRSRVAAVRGVHGRFEVEIATLAPWVDPGRCLGLGECTTACPVSYPDPLSDGVGSRKAIDAAYSGALPHLSSIDPSRCTIGSGCDAPCARACPTQAIDFARQPSRRTIACGAIVVATGMTQAPVPDAPGVISCRALERMLHPQGPTRGEIRLGDGPPPRRVLLATTADTPARDLDLARRELAKLARRLAEALPGVAVEVGTVPSTAAAGSGVDLVVLWTPSRPAAAAEELAGLLRLERDADGFFVEGDDPFAPTGTRVPGVYVAGAAAGPRSLAEAIRDGAAAAGRALSAIVPGERLALAPLAAEIDPARCGACAVCATACPYDAIRRSHDGFQVEVAFCHGCGACAAACPSRAVSAPHFEAAEIRAQISGLLAPLPRLEKDP